MDKVFEVYIAPADSPSEACTTLWLPAQPYELQDALDRVRLGENDALYLEELSYLGFEYLKPFLAEQKNIYKLNVLLKKLSEMDGYQAVAFEGLVKMDINKKEGPIYTERLIDLAYSVGSCHVLPNVKTDAELGRFYAENSFIPELDALPDNVFEMLDFEKIGREQRISEGGVFSGGGYVLLHSDIIEAHENISFAPQAPDYQILLELPDGSRLKLPQDAIPSHKAITCIDCRIPMLMAAIDESDSNDISVFSEKLQSMSDSQVITFKAALYATGCDSLESANEILEQLDHYMLDKSISSPRDTAHAELKIVFGSKPGMGMLAQHTSLHCYGQDLLARDNAVISPYGYLVRDDHQPIQAYEQSIGGMEMM